MKDRPTSRRNLIKGLSLFPVVVAAGSARAADSPGQPQYQPSFFNSDELAFVTALCDRLIPHNEE